MLLYYCKLKTCILVSCSVCLEKCWVKKFLFGRQGLYTVQASTIIVDVSVKVMLLNIRNVK